MNRAVVPSTRITSAVVVLLAVVACGPPVAPASTPVAPSDTPQPSVAGGTWSGTVNRHFSQQVTQPGSVIAQAYDATVQVRSTAVDIGAWDLAGDAAIQASFSSDVVTDTDSSLGHCHTHYTDDVARSQISGTAAGGLQVGEQYEFYVDITGGELPQVSVRDDSRCFGSNVTTQESWPVGPVHAGGGGPVTDPAHLVGTTTEPDGTTVSWDLTLTP